MSLLGGFSKISPTKIKMRFDGGAGHDATVNSSVLV